VACFHYSGEHPQITRWVASAMKAHQPRMKRLSGYKRADILIEALGKRVDQEMKSKYKVAAN
jgi:hypothetical protein